MRLLLLTSLTLVFIGCATREKNVAQPQGPENPTKFLNSHFAILDSGGKIKSSEGDFGWFTNAQISSIPTSWRTIEMEVSWYGEETGNQWLEKHGFARSENKIANSLTEIDGLFDNTYFLHLDNDKWGQISATATPAKGSGTDTMRLLFSQPISLFENLTKPLAEQGGAVNLYPSQVRDADYRP